MPVTIAGHRRVDIEKDTVHCKWVIRDPRGNVLYEVSWRYAFEYEDVADEYYTCIYTALCNEPLSDADLEVLFTKFPDLRFKEQLEVAEHDRTPIQSSTPEPRPAAEERPKRAEKASFKRKVDL